ncbi:MAG TPA: helix-turn-helix domain-containing protein [Blastocatellia bacterium]|nr:helix-turn-helix domain-containing protein [Blastocatellia bacterium]
MTGGAVQHLDVITAPERVATVLSPIRRQLLENLAEPDSASGLARRLGLPRQKINYHLRELERAGFVELHEERQRRGCVERQVRVTSRAFVISEDFLKGLAADPDSIRDKFSSAYLIAAAGRVVRDVALLRERASSVDQRLATLAIETVVSFASPSDFNAFSAELATEIARLAVKYNQQRSRNSRKFRVVVASHPVVTKTDKEAYAEAAEHKNKLMRRKR